MNVNLAAIAISRTIEQGGQYIKRTWTIHAATAEVQATKIATIEEFVWYDADGFETSCETFWNGKPVSSVKEAMGQVFMLFY